MTTASPISHDAVSILTSWELFDPPRRFLEFRPSEETPLPFALWQSTIAPRWKKKLAVLMKAASTASPTEESASDDVVTALHELWCAVLFHRVSSHQAAELLRQVGEQCASSGASAASFLSSNPAVKNAALDSLRWTMEFGLNIVGSPSPPKQKGVGPALASKASQQSNGPGRGTATPDARIATCQQRLLSLLDVVEKSGMLSRVEVIANVPYVQLDNLSFCITKDRLSLMKLNVRIRTKEIFTLPVYNLESENAVGFARLHLLLQENLARVCSTPSEYSCSCKSRYDHWADNPAEHFHCDVLESIAMGLNEIIAEFHLCSNRITHILLLYFQHFLFVMRHDFLFIIARMVSKKRLKELILFQLRNYEEAINKGRIRDRRADLVTAAAEAMHFPSQHFFQLCAYLELENILDIDTIWHNTGPSEAAINKLAEKAVKATSLPAMLESGDIDVPASSEPLTIVPSNTDEKTTDNSNVKSGTDEIEKILTSLNQPEVDATSRLSVQPVGKLCLISAFIELNGWSTALNLLNRLKIVAPYFSLHNSLQISTAIGHLICWLGHPLVSKSPQLLSAFFQLPSALSPVKCAYPDSRCVGIYPSPFYYGVHCNNDISLERSVGIYPVTSAAEFESRLLPIIRCLGTGLSDLNSVVLAMVVSMLEAALSVSGFTATDDGMKSEKTPEIYQSLIVDVVLPCLCTMEPKPSLSEKTWACFRFLNSHERIEAFSKVFHRVVRSPKLDAAAQAVRKVISRELKRVTAEQTDQRQTGTLFITRAGGGRVLGDTSGRAKMQTAQRERNVMDALQKLCCTNPFEVFNTILHQIEMFDTMLIKVIINYLPALPCLAIAAAAFLITERVHTRECQKTGVWVIGQPKPKKLRNNAHFAARFLRRYPNGGLRMLVQSVISRIIRETTGSKYPDSLAGYLGDIVYLEELITWMGEVPKVSTEELSEEQVNCLAAGPSLRYLILVDDERLEEHYRPGAAVARNTLKKVLSDKHIFRLTLLGLAKLKLEIQYDSQLQCGAKSLQLREVASFTDELQSTLLQLVEFLTTPESAILTDVAQDRANFAEILPSASDLLRFCDPALAWTFIRHAVPPVYSQTGDTNTDGTVEVEDLNKQGELLESVSSVLEQGCALTGQHLPAIAGHMFGAFRTSPALERLYVAFWRLDLPDIWIPEEVYKKQIDLINQDIRLVASERQRVANRKTDDAVASTAAWDVIHRRLNEWLKAFEIELAVLIRHRNETIKVLNTQKDGWFCVDKNGVNPVNVFIQHMLGPRILNSQKDALFCTKFIQLLVDMDAFGFILCDFFNKWTGMLTPLVRSCSVQEADNLGLFVNEMTLMMNKWIREPNVLSQAAKENRAAFARLITKPTPAPAISTGDVDMTREEESQKKPSETGAVATCTPVEAGELVKIIGKWENRIFRVIQHGLSLTEKETSWMSQRIVIKFLNQTHQNFPITDVAGSQILRSLPAVIRRAKELRWDDVVANTRALDRNLKSVEKLWLKRREDDDDVDIRTAGTPAGPKLAEDIETVQSPLKDTNANVSTPAPPPVRAASTPAPSASVPTASVSCAPGPKNPFHVSHKVKSPTLPPGAVRAADSSVPPFRPKSGTSAGGQDDDLVSGSTLKHPAAKRQKISPAICPEGRNPVSFIEVDISDDSSRPSHIVSAVPTDSAIPPCRAAIDRETGRAAEPQSDQDEISIVIDREEKQLRPFGSSPEMSSDVQMGEEIPDIEMSDSFGFGKLKEIEALREKLKTRQGQRSLSSPIEPSSPRKASDVVGQSDDEKKRKAPALSGEEAGAVYSKPVGTSNVSRQDSSRDRKTSSSRARRDALPLQSDSRESIASSSYKRDAPIRQSRSDNYSSKEAGGAHKGEEAGSGRALRGSSTVRSSARTHSVSRLSSESEMSHEPSRSHENKSKASSIKSSHASVLQHRTVTAATMPQKSTASGIRADNIPTDRIKVQSSVVGSTKTTTNRSAVYSSRERKAPPLDRHVSTVPTDQSITRYGSRGGSPPRSSSRRVTDTISSQVPSLSGGRGPAVTTPRSQRHPSTSYTHPSTSYSLEDASRTTWSTSSRRAEPSSGGRTSGKTSTTESARWVEDTRYDDGRHQEGGRSRSGSRTMVDEWSGVRRSDKSLADPRQDRHSSLAYKRGR